MFMQMYPAYTINSIEKELSWRQVKKQMACWKDSESSLKCLIGIEKMIEVKAGFKRTAREVLGGEKLEAKLREVGWL